MPLAAHDAELVGQRHSQFEGDISTLTKDSAALADTKQDYQANAAKFETDTREIGSGCHCENHAFGKTVVWYPSASSAPNRPSVSFVIA